MRSYLVLLISVSAVFTTNCFISDSFSRSSDSVSQSSNSLSRSSNSMSASSESMSRSSNSMSRSSSKDTPARQSPGGKPGQESQGGTTIWDSSIHSSNSSANSSRGLSTSFIYSSMSSSEGGKNKSSFRHDIKLISAHYGKEIFASSSWETDVASVAVEFGITDWESEPMTWLSIGAGLKKSGLESGELKSLAMASGKFQDQQIALILEGFASK